MQDLSLELTKYNLFRFSCISSIIVIAVSTLSPYVLADGHGTLSSSTAQQALNQTMKENAVFLRATEKQLSHDVVEFIAMNTKPERKVISPKNNRTVSIEEIIQQKCGSIQDGYVDSLLRLNNADQINIELPLESFGTELLLPSCLYIKQLGGDNLPKYIVKEDDNMSSIYGSFTGDEYDLDAIKAYFTNFEGDFDNIQPGDEVQLSYFTATSAIIPSIDEIQFSTALAAFSPQVRTINQPSAVQYGEVILSVESSGTLASINNLCNNTSTTYPFDSEGIFQAIKYIKNNVSPNRLQESRVAIVDNGFLGVETDIDGNIIYHNEKISLKKPFPERLFLLDKFNHLGPSTFGDTEIWAVNYLNDDHVDVSPTSGHGTHVSGLIIGGKAFDSHYPQLFLEDYSYIKLIPINLNRGQKYLPPGSETRLNHSLMSIRDEITPSVVNLSIAYNPKTNLRVLNRVVRQLNLVINSDKYDNTVFVAAAGNEGRNLTNEEMEIYPAKLGGENSKNVITVASHDADQKISDFSNFGKRHVDIAAPGCKIPSWLSLNVTSDLSGTSQAAPLVSFTVALLRTAWSTSSMRLKNRVIYSGDLINDNDNRNKIRSMSTLNIQKSLFIHHDYISVNEQGAIKKYLANVSPISQLQCILPEGAERRSWRKIYSVKKDASGNIFLYYGDKENENVNVCHGEIKHQTEEGHENTLAFEPKFLIENFSIVPYDDVNPQTITVATRDVLEIIKSEK